MPQDDLKRIAFFFSTLNNFPFKKDTNKGKDIPYTHGLGGSVVKMSMLPKAICRLSTITMAFSVEIEPAGSALAQWLRLCCQL